MRGTFVGAEMYLVGYVTYPLNPPPVRGACRYAPIKEFNEFNEYRDKNTNLFKFPNLTNITNILTANFFLCVLHAYDAFSL